MTIAIPSPAPTVSSIILAGSATTNATSVNYTVTFSEAVTGVTAASFTLFGSGVTGSISPVVGSGSVYTVTVNSITGDGSLRLDLDPNGSTITNASSVALTAAYTSGDQYTFDHTAPSITSVGVPANGTYTPGQSLDFTINFSEAMTVGIIGGTPSLSLVLGTTGVNASYLSGSGTNALVFRYIVASGDVDTNGVTVGVVQLNGGSLTDTVGNNALLVLNSVASTTGVLVSTPAPVAPVFDTATVNGNSLVIHYVTPDLDAVNKPANSAYEVKVNGVVDTVTGVAIDAVAKTATLTLTTAVAAGQTVTVAYTDPTGGNDTLALQSAAGTDAASFIATAVTNNTAAPVVPVTPVGVNLTAPVGGGTLQGTPQADVLVGSASKDIFYPAGGKDSVDGGSGIDTVVMSGNRSQYGITHEQDGSFTVRSLTDSNTIVTLKNVERLTFNNETLALDGTTTTAKVAELYQLTLGRNPEEGGLAYYADTASQGLSTAQLALKFVSSPEFAKTQGAADNSTFIAQLYLTAFNRAPDIAGFGFYMNKLAANPGAAGQASVIADFIESPEMAIKLAGLVDQGIPLFNV